MNIFILYSDKKCAGWNSCQTFLDGTFIKFPFNHKNPLQGFFPQKDECDFCCAGGRAGLGKVGGGHFLGCFLLWWGISDSYIVARLTGLKGDGGKRITWRNVTGKIRIT